MPRRGTRITLLMAALVAFPASTSADGIWERVASSEPRDVDPLREAAHRALEEKQPAIASRVALETIRRSPDSPEAHVLLGHARALAGDYEHAADAYARALMLDARALEAVQDASWAARAAVHAERWALAERALRILTERLGRVPARTVAFARLGDVLQTLGPARLEESMIAYRHALLDARGFHPSASIGLALALHRSGKTQEARGWAARAIEHTTEEDLLQAVTGPKPERLARRALLASIRGERAEATRLFRESEAQSPYGAPAGAEPAR